MFAKESNVRGAYFAARFVLGWDFLRYCVLFQWCDALSCVVVASRVPRVRSHYFMCFVYVFGVLDLSPAFVGEHISIVTIIFQVYPNHDCD